MAKVMLICNSDGALAVFRGPLIEQLSMDGHVVLTVSPESGYFERLRKLGAQPQEIPVIRHSISIFGNLIFLFKLIIAIRRERPDVVHNFTHKAIILGGFAARIVRVPIVVATVTGLGTLFAQEDIKSKLLRRLLILLYKWLLPKRTKFIFQNPDDMREFLNKGVACKSKSYQSYGSGIDLGEFPLPSDDLIRRAKKLLADEINERVEDKIVVMFPARGVAEKGFYEFYEAAIKISNNDANNRYLFCHMGLLDLATKRRKDEENFRSMISAGKVHYLGHKMDPYVYMVAADVIALPSYYREGVPRSLIEGLALGKTIVTTDTPGCRETVIEGENGFFCPAQNSTGLAETLLKISNEFLVNSRSLSRTICERKFDVIALNKLTYRLYDFASDCNKNG